MELTKYKHPHRIYSKVTSFTQLLRETHSPLFLPISRGWTGFGIPKSAGWRLSSTTLMDVSYTHSTSSRLDSTTKAMETSVLPSLPSNQFHMVRTPCDLKLIVMASSDLWLQGGGVPGRGWALIKAHRPVFQPVLMSDWGTQSPSLQKRGADWSAERKTREQREV